MALSRLQLIALGAGAYLAFTIATFPASVAVRWFAPDTLALAGIDGTVWRGSAAFGSVSGVSFSDLRWQVRPAALLAGRLDLAVDARIADGFVRTDLTLSGGRLSFSGLRAGFDLAAIAVLLPFAETTGNAAAEIDSLDLVDGWPVRAAGTVRIANLASAPLFPIPGVTTLRFGSFRASLSTTDDGVVAQVTDEGGPLELEGNARLMPERRYRVEARIKPRADAGEVLEQGLNIIDSSPVNGFHRFQRDGQL